MDISVVIPTYNRYEFLKRALTSVQNQTYQAKEIIVIDDGSTDDTSQIKVILNLIQNLGIKTKYIYQENKGVSSARNTGIKHSTCKWIAFLDSDDEWREDKLALHVDYHKQNLNIPMSYTDEKWIRNGIEVKIPKKFKKIGKDIFAENLEYCNIAPSSVLILKEILNQVQNDGVVFDEELEVCEDYDLWLRITCRYEVGLIDEKLITKYAGHEDQLSFKHWGMDRFRVIALENVPYEISSQAENDYNLSFRATTRNLIKQTLVKKYKLLLKGAIKYDKIQDIKNYQEKLKLYE